VLAWLLTPGTRLFHAAATPPIITEGDALTAARALNQSLRERQASLETALEGAVCRADGILLLPDGRTPEGLLPPPLGVAPEKKSQVAPDALLPSSPARVLVPEGAADASLLQVIEARTVLILAATPDGVITGSGFVVGPGLVVTNFHVIREVIEGQGKILVTNKAMGTPRAARVLKSLGPMADTGGDFALLQVEGMDLPAFSLHIPKGSLKLTNVIAAGFPGDVLALDTSFAALKSGDITAVPDLTVTDGTINTEQQLGPDTNVLMHSAPLSSGNSGGPLVDLCGRVVGVNTFVRQGPMQNRGFAIEASDLLSFLKGTTASPVPDPVPCAPVVARPQVTSVPLAPPKETPAKE
jgi:S1-C subfamily serine protease